jgi:hypothetical protein
VTDNDVTSIAMPDVGDYCRRVEDHLTRANAGHLVRIVGPGFELVRRWAELGVPLSVVFRGIDMKTERHREGQARRPLRIEFCESDVRAVFDNWRRAVGFTTGARAADGSDEGAAGLNDGAPGLQTRGQKTPGSTEPDAEPKRPSLARHLDRAIDRLSRIGGRLELPSELRDVCDRILQELVAMREAGSGSRGAVRDAFVAKLPPLDADLAEAVRLHAPADLRAAARSDAEADLQMYRRLSADVWQRSVDVTTDRLLRDRLGLPLLEL